MDTKTDLAENNRMIADFMGIEIKNEWRDAYEYASGFVWGFNDEHYDMSDTGKLGFATSFDWLMPVIEKIERECGDIDVQVTTGGTRIFEWRSKGRVIADNVGELHLAGKIEHVYAAVVGFLKWRMDPAPPGSRAR